MRWSAFNRKVSSSDTVFQCGPPEFEAYQSRCRIRQLSKDIAGFHQGRWATQRVTKSCLLADKELITGSPVESMA
jgi:hypothetical protein